MVKIKPLSLLNMLKPHPYTRLSREIYVYWKASHGWEIFHRVCHGATTRRSKTTRRSMMASPARSSGAPAPPVDFSVRLLFVPFLFPSSNFTFLFTGRKAQALVANNETLSKRTRQWSISKGTMRFQLANCMSQLQWIAADANGGAQIVSSLK